MTSRRKEANKKDSAISGEIQLQFTVADPANPSASPSDILQKFMALVRGSSGEEIDEDEELSKLGSHDVDEDEDDDRDLDTSDETDDPAKPEVAEKRKKRLRLARLKRKTKARAYEFTGGSDVIGIAFVEIEKITDLPPERNGMSSR